MPVPYKNVGPVDANLPADLSQVKGKTVIVTGGSSGLGLGYVEGFLKAGAYVTNADLQPAKDLTPLSDGKYQFVKCDTTKHSDVVNVFKSALKHSPSGHIDVVIANAGISGNDTVYNLSDGPDPVEPDLKVLNVNLIGVLYTMQVAQHYWRSDPRPGDEKCFIIKSSLAGYLAVPGATVYSTSKYAVRGLMIQTRMSDRCRVNVIAPWFIRTNIMTDTAAESITKMLDSAKSGWAEVEDAVKAALRLAADKEINGRAVGIIPRQEAKEGYVDLQVDDYEEIGKQDMAKWAEIVHLFNHRIAPAKQT